MTEQSSSEVGVIVTVDRQLGSKLMLIADQLSAIGLKDVGTLESIGVITGTCDTDLVAKMQAVSGVAAVEVSGDVRSAPPESDIQ